MILMLKCQDYYPNIHLGFVIIVKILRFFVILVKLFGDPLVHKVEGDNRDCRLSVNYMNFLSFCMFTDILDNHRDSFKIFPSN